VRKIIVEDSLGIAARWTKTSKAVDAFVDRGKEADLPPIRLSSAAPELAAVFGGRGEQWIIHQSGADGQIVNLGTIEGIAKGQGRCFIVNVEESPYFGQRDGHLFATQNRCPQPAGSAERRDHRQRAKWSVRCTGTSRHVFGRGFGGARMPHDLTRCAKCGAIHSGSGRLTARAKEAAPSDSTQALSRGEHGRASARPAKLKRLLASF